MAVFVKVQENDFNVQEEFERIKVTGRSGAIATFIGCVREFSNSEQTLTLEHYPGMTESVLVDIAEQSVEKFSLLNASIVHRVGHLQPGDNIVWVGTTSEHRSDAITACECIIDLLKTQAPFWKREGTQWVEAKSTDLSRAASWKLR